MLCYTTSRSKGPETIWKTANDIFSILLKIFVRYPGTIDTCKTWENGTTKHLRTVETIAWSNSAKLKQIVKRRFFSNKTYAKTCCSILRVRNQSYYFKGISSTSSSGKNNGTDTEIRCLWSFQLILAFCWQVVKSFKDMQISAFFKLTSTNSLSQYQRTNSPNRLIYVSSDTYSKIGSDSFESVISAVPTQFPPSLPLSCPPVRGQFKTNLWRQTSC